MAIRLLPEVNYVYTSLYLQLLAIVHQLAPVFLMKVSRPSTRMLGKCKKFGFGTRLLFEGSGGRVTIPRVMKYNIHILWVETNILYMHTTEGSSW